MVVCSCRAVTDRTVHAAICGGAGTVDELASLCKAGSLKLIERILYLDGLPNLQRVGTVRVGETPVEKLQLALALEQAAIQRLNDGIARCVGLGDNGSRELLEEILTGEEDHADWLESQLELVRQLGEAHYLAQFIHD